jgi:Mg-chelatase subunit ChlD
MKSEYTYLEQAARGLVKLSRSLTDTATRVILEMFIIILDHSGSMGTACGRGDRLKAAQDATIALLDTRQHLGADDQIAVIAFDDEATLVLPFTPCRGYRPQIDAAVRSVTVAGGTNLRKPLILANQMWEHQINVHIVLLSDGQDSEDPTRAARRLKDRGAIVETIGVGNDPSEVDEAVLKATATVLNGKVLYRFIRDADEMATYFRTEIANRLVKRSEP